jgi:hypothetical protein
MRLSPAHLVEDPVDAQRLGDDVARGADRVQRRVGILEDVLHVPAHAAHVAARQVGDVLAGEGDAPAGDGIRPITARPVVVLPQPDSPTRPTVSPRAR